MGPVTRVSTPAVLRTLPKVELHVHLEGTIEAGRVEELAHAAGQEPPRAGCGDLDGLLDALDRTCALARRPEQVERIAHDFCARVSRDGTAYAEVIVNPTHWSSLPADELLTAVASGFDRGEADGLADCRILPSLARSQSSESAAALVEWMAAARPARVVGLSIDGNEARTGRTADRFAPAFALAAAEGFGRVVHAGESSGPEGVLDALDRLGAQRIDHGVRAVEDPALVERLARERVALGVCVSSNLALLYDSFEEHPLGALRAAGVPITLGTDDPEYLGVDLTGELALVVNRYGWSLADAIDVTRTAIDAAFCSPETKAELRARLDEFAAR